MRDGASSEGGGMRPTCVLTSVTSGFRARITSVQQVRIAIVPPDTHITCANDAGCWIGCVAIASVARKSGDGHDAILVTFQVHNDS